jgi:hypothetical protein
MAKHDENQGGIGEKKQQIAGVSARHFYATADKNNN